MMIIAQALSWTNRHAGVGLTFGIELIRAWIPCAVIAATCTVRDSDLADAAYSNCQASSRCASSTSVPVKLAPVCLLKRARSNFDSSRTLSAFAALPGA